MALAKATPLCSLMASARFKKHEALQLRSAILGIRCNIRYTRCTHVCTLASTARQLMQQGQQSAVSLSLSCPDRLWGQKLGQESARLARQPQYRSAKHRPGALLLRHAIGASLGSTREHGLQVHRVPQKRIADAAWALLKRRGGPVSG